jgi:hypothetical protein
MSHIRTINQKLYIQVGDSAMPMGEAMQLEKKFKSDGYLTELIKAKKQRIGTMEASMATLWIHKKSIANGSRKAYSDPKDSLKNRRK